MLLHYHCNQVKITTLESNQTWIVPSLKTTMGSYMFLLWPPILYLFLIENELTKYEWILFICHSISKRICMSNHSWKYSTTKWMTMDNLTLPRWSDSNPIWIKCVEISQLSRLWRAKMTLKMFRKLQILS